MHLCLWLCQDLPSPSIQVASGHRSYKKKHRKERAARTTASALYQTRQSRKWTKSLLIPSAKPYWCSLFTARGAEQKLVIMLLYWQTTYKLYFRYFNCLDSSKIKETDNPNVKFASLCRNAVLAFMPWLPVGHQVNEIFPSGVTSYLSIISPGGPNVKAAYTLAAVHSLPQSTNLTLAPNITFQVWTLTILYQLISRGGCVVLFLAQIRDLTFVSLLCADKLLLNHFVAPTYVPFSYSLTWLLVGKVIWLSAQLHSGDLQHSANLLLFA